MSRGRVERLLVTAVGSEGSKRRPDDLIVEEPMTVQLDGIIVSTTMRTPGHDFELAAGFCHTEGLLMSHDRSRVSVTGVRYCGMGTAMSTEFNIVNVETHFRAAAPRPRLGLTSSSCGWCGSDQLDELTARLVPLVDGARIPLDVIRTVPDAVAAQQELFARTGAVHAAATFDSSGAVQLVREDVGRHNAVDKVVGALLLANDLPAQDLGLFVSGRASVEMVQKAWSAGFSTLVAVSAPTALAVAAARMAGMTLVGFVRQDRFNIYAPESWP